MIFLIEALAACALFTLIVVPSVIKDPLAWVDDYPPAIGQRVRELGLVKADAAPRSARFWAVKAAKSLFIAVLLALAVVFLNGAEGFADAFAISCGLWLIVAWYDALVLDCLWMPRCKKAVIPGTEDMTAEYHNYKFHIKMSALGSLLGLPVCAVVGLLSLLINALR